MTRRSVLRTGAAAALTGLATKRLSGQPRTRVTSPDTAGAAPFAAAPFASAPFTSGRPPLAQRHFRSEAVEAAIVDMQRFLPSAELAWMFGNCFPNTLDTTVFPGGTDAQPDTYVITGDIDAMWLRDSGAQVWPYMPFAKQDANLRRLLRGVINRQTRSILLDPYANAFTRKNTDPPLSWAVHDDTTMKPGVAERKWEIDSLCYPIRLAHAYWKATGDTTPFDAHWASAMRLVVATFRQQQRRNGRGPYHFQRASKIPSDSLNLDGYGNPGRAVGMIFSGFRSSDDACVLPLLVSDNLFAVVSLRQLAEMANGILHDAPLASASTSLAGEVEAATHKFGRAQHPTAGDIWAYEVDGYGSVLCMDDAGAPGSLSLPYLGCCANDDPLYLRTRAFALSEANPFFVRGKAGAGIGSPHTGDTSIWPMSILYQALTSRGDAEILACVRLLMKTTAGTGFIHESFQKDDSAKFTRPWFAWCNSLFGELILKLRAEKPELLRSV